MASIRSFSKFGDKIASLHDKASEHVQSEGEILIKSLVQKQICTSVRLDEQLAQEKEFTSPKDLTRLTDIASGEISLDEFKSHNNFLETIDELKYYGLTTHEVVLYLDSKKGEEHLLTKHKNINKSILFQQLSEISEKINKRKSEAKQVTEKKVSRHLKEIGLSVKPNSEETKLFEFALNANCSRDEGSVPLNHPINHLKDIENELFGYLERDDVPSLAKRRKKLKKIEKFDDFCINTSVNSSKKSKWDVQINEILQTNVSIAPTVIKQTKIYTCTPQQLYTIKDGSIIKLQNNKDTHVKELEKLTEEELKKIPRFQNYERGIPSKVLYVKNIANSAKEDFLNLFQKQNTDEQSVECKLLTGKMKGQAFVTFKSEDEATAALLQYNGCVFGGKPVVIQYGKSHV